MFLPHIDVSLLICAFTLRRYAWIRPGFTWQAEKSAWKPGGGKSSFYDSDLGADWTPGDIQSWATRGITQSPVFLS